MSLVQKLKAGDRRAKADEEYKKLLEKHDWHSAYPPRGYLFGIGRGARPISTAAAAGATTLTSADASMMAEMDAIAQRRDQWRQQQQQQHADKKNDVAPSKNDEGRSARPAANQAMLSAEDVAALERENRVHMVHKRAVTDEGAAADAHEEGEESVAVTKAAERLLRDLQATASAGAGDGADSAGAVAAEVPPESLALLEAWGDEQDPITFIRRARLLFQRFGMRGQAHRQLERGVAALSPAKASSVWVELLLHTAAWGPYAEHPSERSLDAADLTEALLEASMGGAAALPAAAVGRAREVAERAVAACPTSSLSWVLLVSLQATAQRRSDIALRALAQNPDDSTLTAVVLRLCTDTPAERAALVEAAVERNPFSHQILTLWAETTLGLARATGPTAHEAAIKRCRGAFLTGAVQFKQKHATAPPLALFLAAARLEETLLAAEVVRGADGAVLAALCKAVRGGNHPLVTIVGRAAKLHLGDELDRRTREGTAILATAADADARRALASAHGAVAVRRDVLSEWLLEAVAIGQRGQFITAALMLRAYLRHQLGGRVHGAWCQDLVSSCLRAAGTGSARRSSHQGGGGSAEERRMMAAIARAGARAQGQASHNQRAPRGGGDSVLTAPPSEATTTETMLSQGSALDESIADMTAALRRVVFFDLDGSATGPGATSAMSPEQDQSVRSVVMCCASLVVLFTMEASLAPTPLSSSSASSSAAPAAPQAVASTTAAAASASPAATSDDAFDARMGASIDLSSVAGLLQGLFGGRPSDTEAALGLHLHPVVQQDAHRQHGACGSGDDAWRLSAEDRAAAYASAILAQVLAALTRCSLRRVDHSAHGMLHRLCACPPAAAATTTAAPEESTLSQRGSSLEKLLVAGTATSDREGESPLAASLHAWLDGLHDSGVGAPPRRHLRASLDDIKALRAVVVVAATTWGCAGMHRAAQAAALQPGLALVTAAAARIPPEWALRLRFADRGARPHLHMAGVPGHGDESLAGSPSPSQHFLVTLAEQQQIHSLCATYHRQPPSTQESGGGGGEVERRGLAAKRERLHDTEDDADVKGQPTGQQARPSSQPTRPLPPTAAATTVPLPTAFIDHLQAARAACLREGVEALRGCVEHFSILAAATATDAATAHRTALLQLHKQQQQQQLCSVATALFEAKTPPPPAPQRNGHADGPATGSVGENGSTGAAGSARSHQQWLSTALLLQRMANAVGLAHHPHQPQEEEVNVLNSVQMRRVLLAAAPETERSSVFQQLCSAALCEATAAGAGAVLDAVLLIPPSPAAPQQQHQSSSPSLSAHASHNTSGGSGRSGSSGSSGPQPAMRLLATMGLIPPSDRSATATGTHQTHNGSGGSGNAAADARLCMALLQAQAAECRAAGVACPLSLYLWPLLCSVRLWKKRLVLERAACYRDAEQQAQLAFASSQLAANATALLYQPIHVVGLPLDPSAAASAKMDSTTASPHGLAPSASPLRLGAAASSAPPPPPAAAARQRAQQHYLHLLRLATEVRCPNAALLWTMRVQEAVDNVEERLLQRQVDGDGGASPTARSGGPSPAMLFQGLRKLCVEAMHRCPIVVDRAAHAAMHSSFTTLSSAQATGAPAARARNALDGSGSALDSEQDELLAAAMPPPPSTPSATAALIQRNTALVAALAPSAIDRTSPASAAAPPVSLRAVLRQVQVVGDTVADGLEALRQAVVLWCQVIAHRAYAVVMSDYDGAGVILDQAAAGLLAPVEALRKQQGIAEAALLSVSREQQRKVRRGDTEPHLEADGPHGSAPLEYASAHPDEPLRHAPTHRLILHTALTHALLDVGTLRLLACQAAAELARVRIARQRVLGTGTGVAQSCGRVVWGGLGAWGAHIGPIESDADRTKPNNTAPAAVAAGTGPSSFFAPAGARGGDVQRAASRLVPPALHREPLSVAKAAATALAPLLKSAQACWTDRGAPAARRGAVAAADVAVTSLLDPYAAAPTFAALLTAHGADDAAAVCAEWLATDAPQSRGATTATMLAEWGVCHPAVLLAAAHFLWAAGRHRQAVDEALRALDVSGGWSGDAWATILLWHRCAADAIAGVLARPEAQEDARAVDAASEVDRIAEAVIVPLCHQFKLCAPHVLRLPQDATTDEWAGRVREAMRTTSAALLNTACEALRRRVRPTSSSSIVPLSAGGKPSGALYRLVSKEIARRRFALRSSSVAGLSSQVVVSTTLTDLCRTRLDPSAALPQVMGLLQATPQEE